MQLLKTITVLFTIIVVSQATSQPIIRNTKATGILGDIAGDYCEWDGAKLFPGSIQEFQRGHCRRLFCTDNFDILITPCAFDMTGRFVWANPNTNKPYPQCCGDRVDTWMAAERV